MNCTISRATGSFIHSCLGVSTQGALPGRTGKTIWTPSAEPHTNARPTYSGGAAWFPKGCCYPSAVQPSTRYRQLQVPWVTWVVVAGIPSTPVTTTHVTQGTDYQHVSGYTAVKARWHMRSNQISPFGETDESMWLGGGDSSVDCWQPRCAGVHVAFVVCGRDYAQPSC
jgi:hypothetical protein